MNPGVPIAFFVGAEDVLADPTDASEAWKDIGTAGIQGGYHLIPNFDHGSFCMGVDMSYMNTVVSYVNQYNK